MVARAGVDTATPMTNTESGSSPRGGSHTRHDDPIEKSLRPVGDGTFDFAGERFSTTWKHDAPGSAATGICSGVRGRLRAGDSSAADSEVRRGPAGSNGRARRGTGGCGGIEVKRGNAQQFVGYLADASLETSGLAGDAVMPRSAAKVEDALRATYGISG